MAARDDSGGSNLMPIVGGLVVGAGIVALIYKMFFMEGGMSTSPPPQAEPVIAEKEKEKDIEPEPKDKANWPCPQSIPQGPCSNPYDRRTPYCQ